MRLGARLGARKVGCSPKHSLIAIIKKWDGLLKQNTGWQGKSKYRVVIRIVTQRSQVTGGSCPGTLPGACLGTCPGQADFCRHC